MKPIADCCAKGKVELRDSEILWSAQKLILVSRTEPSGSKNDDSLSNRTRRRERILGKPSGWQGQQYEDRNGPWQEHELAA
jgi:hypothetical protein